MRGKTGHEQQEYREQQRLAWLSEVEATSGRPMEELLGHPSYARAKAIKDRGEEADTEEEGLC